MCKSSFTLPPPPPLHITSIHLLLVWFSTGRPGPEPAHHRVRTEVGANSRRCPPPVHPSNVPAHPWGRVSHRCGRLSGGAKPGRLDGDRKRDAKAVGRFHCGGSRRIKRWIGRGVTRRDRGGRGGGGPAAAAPRARGCRALGVPEALLQRRPAPLVERPRRRALEPDQQLPP